MSHDESQGFADGGWARRPWSWSVSASPTLGGVASAALDSRFGAEPTDLADQIELGALVPAADLYPGFTGGDLRVTIVNDSDEPRSFTELVSAAVVPSDPTNCPPENVVVDLGRRVDVVAPAYSSTDVRLDDVVTMVRAAPDGCQGVSFTVEVSLGS